MNGKITLITPPDIYENENTSILLVNLSEQEQDDVSLWFSNSNITGDINLYLYEGQVDMPWLLHAVARSEYRYINLNNSNNITQAISGYLLGKANFHYKIDDKNLSAIFSHINHNRVEHVEAFLERIPVEQAKS